MYVGIKFPSYDINLSAFKGVDHSKKSLSKFYLNTFNWSQLRSSWSPHVSSGFLLRDMGLFVLQCKHAEDDSSNPGNLIESSWALNLIFWQKTGYPCHP